MNKLSRLLAICILVSSTSASAADRNDVPTFRDHHQCIYDVAEKFYGPLRNMVSSACFRMFNAPDEQKPRYACVVDVARQTADTQVVVAAFSACSDAADKR